MRNTVKAIFFATATLFGINSYGQDVSCGTGQRVWSRVISIVSNESATNGKFAVYFVGNDGVYYSAASASGFSTETPGGKNNFELLLDAARNGLGGEMWCSNGGVISVSVVYAGQ